MANLIEGARTDIVMPMGEVGCPTYAAQMMRPFRRLVASHPALADLPPQAEEAADAERVPVATGQRTLQQLVDMTGDPDFGLKAARESTVGDFDVLEYVTLSSATWRSALATAFRYARIVNGAADFHLEVRGSHACVLLGSRVPLCRAGIDFQCGAYHVSVARWLRPLPEELEALFRHPEPDNVEEYEKTFPGLHLRFSAEWDGFRFDSARLDTPLSSADASLHQVLRGHADRLLSEIAPGDSLSERVRAHILATMGVGTGTAELTAVQLGMSRRSLTRHLREEGTTFSELLSDVRRKTSLHYLEHTNYSVEDIAFMLGFSESPPFVRAFKRWTGSAPLQFRQISRRRP